MPTVSTPSARAAPPASANAAASTPIPFIPNRFIIDPNASLPAAILRTPPAASRRASGSASAALGRHADPCQILKPALRLDEALDLGRHRPRVEVVHDEDHHR